MRKTVITASVLAALSVIVVLWTVSLNAGPRYAGRGFKSWFEQYYRALQPGLNASVIRADEARKALRAMGTNAVLCLLDEMYTRTDVPWRTNLHRQLMRLPLSVRPMPYVRADIIRNAAADAIIDLNPPENLIVTSITNHLHNGDSQGRYYSLRVLNRLQFATDEAISTLRTMVRETNTTQQLLALQFLCMYQKAAQPAVLEVADWLKQNGSLIGRCNYALSIIGNLGPAASNAVPALLARMEKDSPPDLRLRCASVLARVDPHQVAAFDTLLELANDKSALDYTRSALYSLKEIDQRSVFLRSFLSEATHAEAVDVWLPAVRSLKLIGQTDSAMTAASAKLESSNAVDRVNASLFIVNHEPARNQKATSQLVAFVKDDYWGGVTIRQVVRLPTVPGSAREALHEIASNQSHKNQQYAAEALRTIETADRR